jgi:hypothetical protein
MKVFKINLRITFTICNQNVLINSKKLLQFYKTQMCEQEFKIEMNIYFSKIKSILKLETYKCFICLCPNSTNVI